MNNASADLFVAFSIVFRLCVTLHRPMVAYVGVVSLYVVGLVLFSCLNSRCSAVRLRCVLTAAVSFVVEVIPCRLMRTPA